MSFLRSRFLVLLGLSSAFLFPVEAVLKVDEAKVVAPVNPLLLGYNFEFPTQHYLNMGITNNAPPQIAPWLVKTFEGFPIPISRASGTSSQHLSFKESIGPFQERLPQRLVKWKPAEPLWYGPVEWIKHVQSINPNAVFTWCFNFYESAEDAADIAEFLTSDGGSNPGGGVNWGEKRRALGIDKPVPVVAWELGNELDGSEFRSNWSSPALYIKKCREVIAAVRKVHPRARFAPHAATLSSLAVYQQFFGGEWTIWHQAVLRELGPDIDYLVFHPYINSLSAGRFEKDFVNKMSQDIREITGSDRIKIYFSEHAWWPKQTPGKHKTWQDSWYTTFALVGCLSTANWINRMAVRNDIAFAAYHCFLGGPWSLALFKGLTLGKDVPAGEGYVTGIFDTMKLLNECFQKPGEVLFSELTGMETDPLSGDYTLSASFSRHQNGTYSLIFVNQSPETDREIRVESRKRYRLIASKILSGENLDSHNTLAKKAILITEKNEGNSPLSVYKVPARSLVLATLKEE